MMPLSPRSAQILEEDCTRPDVPTPTSYPEGWVAGRITRKLHGCLIVNNDIFVHKSVYVGSSDTKTWFLSIEDNTDIEVVVEKHQQGRNNWRAVKARSIGDNCDDLTAAQARLPPETPSVTTSQRTAPRSPISTQLALTRPRSVSSPRHIGSPTSTTLLAPAMESLSLKGVTTRNKPAQSIDTALAQNWRQGTPQTLATQLPPLQMPSGPAPMYSYSQPYPTQLQSFPQQFPQAHTTQQPQQPQPQPQLPPFSQPLPQSYAPPQPPYSTQAPYSPQAPFQSQYIPPLQAFAPQLPSQSYASQPPPQQQSPFPQQQLPFPQQQQAKFQMRLPLNTLSQYTNNQQQLSPRQLRLDNFRLDSFHLVKCLHGFRHSMCRRDI